MTRDIDHECVSCDHSLLNKHDGAAAIFFLLRVRLVCEHAGFVLLDLGRNASDQLLHRGELVWVRSDDGDDVDFRGRHFGYALEGG